MLQAGDQALLEVGLSHRKAETVRVLAEAFAGGALTTDATDSDLLAGLESLPGIGPASARRFLWHYLHRPDVFPATDPSVREAISVLDRESELITPKAAERRSARWRPYRSYAAAYLTGYVWEKQVR